MNPKVMNKLKSMGGEKGIDLSIIMGKPPMHEMGGMEMSHDLGDSSEMPEVGAETIYKEIKDKLSMLDSDEILRLLNMFLNERMSVLD